MKDAYLNNSHEFMQSLPLTLKQVECVRCGIKTKIGDFDIKKCTPHFVGVGSGWPVMGEEKDGL
jgi:hypothetical protein